MEAVIFDLDGVLLDSEQLWDQVRRQVATEHGVPWPDGATEAMQGMSSVEWARYMHERLDIKLPPERINAAVVERLLERFTTDLPLLPGAVEVVERLRRLWPVALASSSNRAVIERVLALTGLAGAFAATVSSEEVPRGKPAPDVYREAARRLGLAETGCVAVEDSANGIRSALAAGMAVVAIPNRHYPPPAEVLARTEVLEGLDDLTGDAVGRAADTRRPSDPPGQPGEQRLDEVEIESFPASDPHADWAGPPG